MGTKLSPREYIKLAREYKVKLHEHFEPPWPPAYYAEVQDKESNRVLAYLSFNPAREEWTMLTHGFNVGFAKALFS